MKIAYFDHGNYATDIRHVDDDYQPSAGEKVIKGDKLPTLQELGYTPILSFSHKNRDVLAQLDLIDLKSIRALREYIASKADAPQILKDHESAAQSERAKIKK